MQELTPKQEEFLRNKSRYKVANWGRRSGKTTLFAYEALGTALEANNRHITYYAQTFGDARDIAWDIFIETFGEAVAKKNESLLEITLFTAKGGFSKVSLKGWESVILGGKGRGTENDLLLFDEVAFCRLFLQEWVRTLEPTLLTTKGRAVFGSTPNGFNDFYHLTQQAQEDDDWFYSHATSYDNPFNDPADLDKIKAKRTEDAFAQEYLADFRRVSGLVYKEYDQNRHKLSEMPERYASHNVLAPSIEKRGCLDFGFNNPAAMYTVLKDSDGVYYITDEFYEPGKLHEELAQIAASRGVRDWYADPEDAEGRAHLTRKGLTVKEVNKSVKAGINTVQQLFKQNRLFIVNCPNLEFELNFYRWRDRTNSKIDLSEPEEPVKENDHGCDAIRYCLHMWETVGGQSAHLKNYYKNLGSSGMGSVRT